MSNDFQARRRFLQRSLCAALASSGLGAMNSKLSLVGSALAASGDYTSLTDYKALVCVFLYGGSDAFNLFVPLEQARYDNYAASRGALALGRSSLLADAAGDIGFHPRLGALRDLYDSGKLALVSNVGNLITPIDRIAYQAGGAGVPTDLFAHNHQQEQWLKGWSSRPTSVVGPGWGGRMADLLADANAGSALPPSFTLAGSNFWQPGYDSSPTAVHPRDGMQLLGYLDDRTGGSRNVARNRAIDAITSLGYTNELMQYANSAFVRARDSSRLISQVVASRPAFATSYNAANSAAQQLRMVANLIAGREQLGMKRQIFFVGMGGWDTHDFQTVRLDQLARDLDHALSSFQATLAELQLEDSVTTFTASDFGRTVTVNGDGSDHGWGGHYLVMGGAVQGGQLVGDWPDFTVGGDDDSGDKGRIIPSLSVNQFGGALARWMGLSAGDVLEVFPDLANFDGGWDTGYGLFDIA